MATPIGNLGDFSVRAIETLKKVDLIACEDTRRSKILLDHYGIQKPLVSYFDHSERRKTPFLIEKLKNGAGVALVSDAGTPGIADPGYRLIRAAIDEGIRIESLPGASAFLTALALSGLPADWFIFEGFFPVKEGQKRKLFSSLRDQERTVIFYESPHRLLKTLRLVEETLGDIPLVVARELTKKFEEVWRGSASGAIRHFSEKKILGELVVLWSMKK